MYLRPFLELPEDYLFADMPIAQGPSSGWSFPGWPSHLDHLLISDELFNDFNAPSTEVACLDIAAHMSGGWSEYDYNVSDHRPVAIQMMVTPPGNFIGTRIQPGHLNCCTSQTSWGGFVNTLPTKFFSTTSAMARLENTSAGAANRHIEDNSSSADSSLGSFISETPQMFQSCYRVSNE
jgi:hypothetical protein